LHFILDFFASKISRTDNFVQINGARNKSWFVRSSPSLSLQKNNYISTLVKKVQLKYLSTVLTQCRDKEQEVSQKVQFHEQELKSCRESTTKIVLEYNRRQQLWQNELENSKAMTTALEHQFVYEYLLCNLKIKRVQQNLQSLAETATECPHWHSKDVRILKPLEDQQQLIRKLDTEFLKANEQLNRLKEKPKEVQFLAKNLQEAKKLEFQVLTVYNEFQTLFVDTKRERMKIQKVINSINGDPVPLSRKANKGVYHFLYNLTATAAIGLRRWGFRSFKTHSSNI